MHICFLTYEYPKPGYPHGGIGTFIKGIAEKLVERQIRVTVITVDPDTSKTKDTVVNDGLLTIIYQHCSHWPAFGFWDYSRRFNKHIKAIHRHQPIDVLEGHEISFAFIKKIPGIAYVIRMNGGHHFFAEAENRPLESKKVWKEKDSFSKADALIAVSQYANIRTATHLGFDASKTAIIPNGINISRFEPGTAADIVPGRIVFAGTVIEKKGIRQLIMALPAVKKQFPETHLLVLGNLKAKHRETGGLYMDYLRNYIDPSVSDAIDFVGFVNNDQLQEYIRTAAVCVFPSHMETQGIVAAEAMIMEKLVIFGKDGPGPEVIEDGVTGLLCDPHNPAHIAAKIIEAFSNKEAGIKMAANARQAALSRYDTELLIEKNIAFYKKAIHDIHPERQQ